MQDTNKTFGIQQHQVATTPPYHPNLNDLRVINRLKKTINGIQNLFKEEESRHSAKMINQILGHQSNPVSKWLREVVLVTTDEFYSKDAQYCKGHKLNKEGFEYIVKLLNGKTEVSWEAYREDLQTSKKHYFDINLSKINADNELEDLDNYTLDIQLEYCERKFGDDLRRGTILYTEKCYRYWHDLQSYPRPLRDAFLARNGFHYDYDIQCCNVTLIMQYAEQCLHNYRKSHSNKKSMVLRNDAILKYIRKKDEIRQQISDEVCVPIETVKAVITALVNGASLKNRYGSLYETLGSRVARKFYQIDFIRRFIDNIKSCWECITAYDDRRKETLRRMKNGEAKTVKSKLKANQKAVIYFQLEKNVTDVVRNYCLDKGYKTFFIHDGWVTNNLIDTHELLMLIKIKTGYSIKLDLEVIGKH